MIKTARRIQGVPAHFFARLHTRLADLTSQGVDVIRLDVGSPDLPPAPHIIGALKNAADKPNAHGYQPQRGTPELRRAWAAMYQDVHGVELDPEVNILPLLGSKEGVFHMPLAFLESGDVALVPDPGYITYFRGAQLAGGEIYTLPLKEDNGYLPDLRAIPKDILKHARLLWLNYPNNPTAALATGEFFSEAVSFAREHGILICHDAAYSRITFTGRPALSLLQIPGALEVGLEFNTLSKTYNMAGWRVGAAVGAPEVIELLTTLKTTIDSGHFLPVMEAAVAALRGDQSWLVERDKTYRRRRDLLVGGLRGMGFNFQEPQASLYLWCQAPEGWDGDSFTLSLLEQSGVSMTPGSVFGRQGRDHFRVSITAAEDRIAEALQRMESWMQKWG